MRFTQREPAVRGTDGGWDSVLYEENGRVAAFFWGWRHRLMVFYFTGASALVVVAGWLVDHRLPPGWVALPMLTASGLSMLVTVIDRRISTILTFAYGVGRRLEAAHPDAPVALVYEQLALSRASGRGPDSPFARRWWAEPRNSMSFWLPVAYLSLGLGFGVLGVWELVDPVEALAPRR